MDEQNRWARRYLSRRDFIRYSLAGGVVAWAGTQIPPWAGLDAAEAQEVFANARLDTRRFPQSVASGDPGPDGIVLWTRALPPPQKRGDNIRVYFKVALDDERDDATAFEDPVLSGYKVTGRERDFTVKVQLPLPDKPELESSTKYRYRFYYGDARSKTGRFMTLPNSNKTFGVEETVRFAYISCQDYTNGYYHALRFLAEEDVDFVVHLGDYIYETVGDPSFQSGGPEERQFRFPKDGRRDDRREALSLRDYRFTYRKYRTDPYLQAVHENFAFITIWDDHEFANDAYRVYAPDQGGTDEVPSRNPRRRQVANRAWAEYTPTGVTYTPKSGPLDEIQIYRSFVFGDLLELVMTDERLYRDGPPCGNKTEDRYLTPGCDDATGEEEGEEAPERTMLGSAQLGSLGAQAQNDEGFFLPKVVRSSRTWKVWGNEVMFMQFKVANAYVDALFPNDDPNFPTPVEPAPNDDGIYVTLDQWDGYQAERLRITQEVGGEPDIPEPLTENFVAITGDIHSYLAGYIKYDYDAVAPAPGSKPAGVEFVCGSVTSSNLTELGSFGRGRAPTPDGNEFTQAAKASNPHLAYFNSDNHGYNLVELKKSSLLCTMVGLFATDPEVNPIRVEYGRNDLVQRDVIQEFKVPAVGTTYDNNGVPVPVTGSLLLTREDETQPFVPVPPT